MTYIELFNALRAIVIRLWPACEIIQPITTSDYLGAINTLAVWISEWDEI